MHTRSAHLSCLVACIASPRKRSNMIFMYVRSVVEDWAAPRNSIHLLPKTIFSYVMNSPRTTYHNAALSTCQSGCDRTHGGLIMTYYISVSMLRRLRGWEYGLNIMNAVSVFFNLHPCGRSTFFLLHLSAGGSLERIFVTLSILIFRRARPCFCFVMDLHKLQPTRAFKILVVNQGGWFLGSNFLVTLFYIAGFAQVFLRFSNDALYKL